MGREVSSWIELPVFLFKMVKDVGKVLQYFLCSEYFFHMTGGSLTSF